MKRTEEHDAITRAQNEGIECPYCGAAVGHYGHCATINAYVAEGVAALQVGITEADVISLHALGVRWN